MASLVLFRKVVTKPFGMDIAGRALEPHEEEIRQFSIRHVVVVRWVEDYGVDRSVCPRTARNPPIRW